LTSRQFLELVTSAQEAVVKGDGPPAWMNETQIFWLPQTQQVTECRGTLDKHSTESDLGQRALWC
jgi:hypothetical protein